MPTVSRARELGASPDEVWRVVSDPERLPDWWPGVSRVEEVSAGAWTKVLTSPRGKPIRADYSLVESRQPERLVWRHEVEESPFERILAESLTEIELDPAGSGTRVTVTVRHRPRGWARFSPLQLRRAATRQVEGALAGLAGVMEGDA
jgi:uncharacterized protein YndB with AHSA1/START domain